MEWHGQCICLLFARVHRSGIDLAYIVMLCRSRRPGECDRVCLGLFCDAWLMEKAGRIFP